MSIPITIMSGGQTGVDRAAIDFAIDHNIPWWGWCTRGRRSESKEENYKIPARYDKMKELQSSEYEVRTEYNVRDSDATVLFVRCLPMNGGTLLTSHLATEYHKPLLILVKDKDIMVPEKLRLFIKTFDIRTLNIAGPRESKEPGLSVWVKDVLEKAIL